MLTVHHTPAISLTTSSSRDIEADALILPVFEDDTLKDETDLDTASGGEIAAALARREVTGKAYDSSSRPCAAGRARECCSSEPARVPNSPLMVCGARRPRPDSRRANAASPASP